jgi:pimeloyl-ACP methyl ester carboxylesterase
MLQTIEQGSGPAVLLIHGAGPDATTWHDVIDDLARALAKAVPAARTVSVEGAGHAVSLDQPNRVAEIIRAASHSS